MTLPKVRDLRELPAILFLLSVLIAACGLAAVGLWFAFPREPVLSAGYVSDYTWEDPEYVAIQSDVAVFLDQTDGEIVALSATSPTSNCRIKWVPINDRFEDPCCGGRWNRDGTQIKGDPRSLGVLTRYQIDVNSKGEILLYPWRVSQATDESAC